MKKGMIKRLDLLTLIVILSIIIPITYSKYISTVNDTITLNIRKPIYYINYYHEGSLMDTQEFKYGTAQNIKNNTQTVTGKVFSNWNTEEDGSGTAYNDGQEVNNLSSVDGAVINLYSVFVTDSSYTIIFNSNGGTGSMENMSIEEGNTYTLTANSFTHAKGTFKNWNTKEDGTGRVYRNGASVTTAIVTEGKTITLYAQWLINANIESGSTLNTKMKSLAGDLANITAIHYTATEPSSEYKIASNLVSTSTSDYEIYMWYEGGTIYLWSEANNFKINNSDSLCDALTNLEDISGLSHIDPSNAVQQKFVFRNCQKLIDISPIADWNMSSAKEMTEFFNGCTLLSDLSPIAGWNISNVIKLNSGFKATAISNTDALASWTPLKLADMSNTFEKCPNLVSLEGLRNWNLPEAGTMFEMFRDCTALTSIEPLKGITGLTNLYRMEKMFYGCKSLASLDGFNSDTWNNAKKGNIVNLFDGCTSLSDVSGLSGWNMSQVTSLSNMFSGNTSLTNIDGLSGWASTVNNVTSMQRMFVNCKNLQNVDGLSNWNLESLTTMQQAFYGCNSLASLSGMGSWTGLTQLNNLQEAFRDCSSLTTLDGLGNDAWNSAPLKNCASTFNSSRNIVDASSINDWDITNVTNFGDMFKNITTHPEFTKRAGTWNNGTFTPST